MGLLLPGLNFFLKLCTIKAHWRNKKKRGKCPVTLSKFPPLADFHILILFLFKNCFLEVYYISGPNPKTLPLSRSWKRREVEFRKISRFNFRKKKLQFSSQNDSIYATQFFKQKLRFACLATKVHPRNCGIKLL